MSERRTDDATLISAVRILARTITTEDGVIPACLAEAANRLETLVEERRWIPCDERFPPDNVAVLCWVDGSGAEMAWRENGKWFLSWANVEVSDSTYTYWRPLPTKEESNP